MNVQVFLFLIIVAASLHLRLHNKHMAATSDLNLRMQALVLGLTSLNNSITANLSAINHNNQSQLISSLESIILQSRSSLLQLYNQSSVPLSDQNYYCQNIPVSLSNQISSTLNNISTNANSITQLLPLNVSNRNSFNPAMQMSAHQMAVALQSPGNIVVNAPKQLNQTNLLAQGWFFGNATADNLSQAFQPAYGSNTAVCPASEPFVDKLGNCINCMYYYSVGNKSCSNCTNYDPNAHICNDPTTQVNVPLINGNAANGNTAANSTISNATNPTSNQTNQTVSNITNPKNITNSSNTNYNNTTNPAINSTSNSNSSKVLPTTNQTIPSQMISNSNNFVGLLLPSNTSLTDYKNSLTLNPQNLTQVPCPISQPFFDGTSCIYCQPPQYFSTQIRGCQTCPPQQSYNSSSFHCENTFLYSNPLNNSWISVGTAPSQILEQLNNASTMPNAQPCPIAFPYLSNGICISCGASAPLYSYDGQQCTSCVSPSVFDSNQHSCVTAQNMQTNPSTTSNLVLQGRSLNEWKYYYFNNQTANPQIADCPATKPYFDGLVCISCSGVSPYFNLQYKVCQSCGNGTAYDQSVKQCLSTSGNIVSQSPTLAKMAAGIFA